jgi:hypothetical protein
LALKLAEAGRTAAGFWLMRAWYLSAALHLPLLPGEGFMAANELISP